MPCGGFIKTMTGVNLTYIFLTPGGGRQVWIRITDHHLARYVRVILGHTVNGTLFENRVFTDVTS